MGLLKKAKEAVKEIVAALDESMPQLPKPQPKEENR